MALKQSAWQSADTAKNYLHNVKSYVPLNSAQIDVMLRLIEANGRPVKKFLDLGCGDGFLSSIMLSRYPKSFGVLLDFSDAMLDAARKKLKKYAKQIKVLKYDFGGNEWVKEAAKNGPYDAIVSRYAIHHQKDTSKNRIYSQVYSLLKKGGIFVNIEHVSSMSKWGERVSDENFVDSLYENNTEPHKDKDKIAKKYYYRADKKENILAPIWKQCDWLKEIGFKDVDCYFKVFELTVFAGRK